MQKEHDNEGQIIFYLSEIDVNGCDVTRHPEVVKLRKEFPEGNIEQTLDGTVIFYTGEYEES